MFTGDQLVATDYIVEPTDLKDTMFTGLVRLIRRGTDERPELPL